MKDKGKKEKRKGMMSVGGREVPCRVTMGAMLRYKRETGRDVSKMGTDDLEGMVTFLWCCVTAACRADEVEFGLTLEEFADRLEPAALGGFYDEMAGGEGAEKKS